MIDSQNSYTAVRNPRWFCRPEWLIGVWINMAALGLLVLLVSTNEEIVSQIHDLRSKDIPTITFEEAEYQLQLTGSLSNVRIAGRIWLEDVVIDGFGEFILQNVHFEHDVYVKKLKAKVVRMIDCTFADRADLDLSQVDEGIALWNCSFSSALVLTGLRDQTAVRLNFKQPPDFIKADSRSAAERLHLHAPKVPLTWPAYSAPPVIRDQSVQIAE